MFCSAGAGLARSLFSGQSSGPHPMDDCEAVLILLLGGCTAAEAATSCIIDGVPVCVGGTEVATEESTLQALFPR